MFFQEICKISYEYTLFLCNLMKAARSLGLVYDTFGINLYCMR